MPKTKITVDTDVTEDESITSKYTAVYTSETKIITIDSDEPIETDGISTFRFFENHPDGAYDHGIAYVTVETIKAD